MVRRSMSPRLDFEAEAIYQYPEHLRPSLAELPRAPGVYVFHGESETLPLYIGKSINLRARVMSHLRTPGEAAMLRQARHITFTRTAGELGALLLEAQMIKAQQPLFNKRLRRNRQLCSLLISGSRPEVVYAKEVDFSHTPHLYGLFANRRAALEKLKSIADEQRLCHGLLGLEKLSAGRACFRAALKRCAGACCGMEPVDDHNARLLESLSHLQVMCWPWRGPVAVKEQTDELIQYLVIDNWVWLGTVDNLDDAARLTRASPGFDHDGYKILCRPLIRAEHDIIDLSVT